MRVVVHTLHNKNGVVERKHKHLLEIAIAIKLEANIPSTWGEGGYFILTACYLINLMPTLVLDGKSPHEKLLGKKLNLPHLCVFGCLCYAKIMHNSDKFASRYVAFVMMGYSLTQKA